MEQEPEGGERCAECFRVRLKKTAELAKKEGFDYFCTTLTLSLYKNAEVLDFKTLNGDYGKPYISDHYPVMATMKI